MSLSLGTTDVLDETIFLSWAGVLGPQIASYSCDNEKFKKILTVPNVP